MPLAAGLNIFFRNRSGAGAGLKQRPPPAPCLSARFRRRDPGPAAPHDLGRPVIDTPILNDPVFRTVVAPFAVSLVLAGLLRLSGGPKSGPAMMSLSIVAGVIVAFLLTGLAEPFPPKTGLGKAFYLIVAAALLGLVFEVSYLAKPAEEPALLGFPLVALIWLAWPKLMVGPGVGDVVVLSVAWIAGIVWLARFRAMAAKTGALPGGLLLCLAGGGVAGTALIADAVGLGLFAASVAVSALGFALWRLAALMLMGSPGSFGPLPVFSGGGALLVFVYLMIVQVPRISLWALLVLVLLPFVLLPFKRLLLFDTTASGLITAVLVSVLGGSLAAAAVGIAFLSVTS